MKRSTIVRIAVLVCVSVLLTSVCTSCKLKDLFLRIVDSVQAGNTALSSDYKGYFGFAALDSLENAEKLKYVYDRVCQGVEAQKTEIFLTGYDIDKETLVSAFEVYVYDHPEHFFLDPSSYAMTLKDEDTVRSVRVSYTFSASERKEAEEKINGKIDEILNNLKKYNGHYDIEQYIHNWIIENTTYKDVENAHNIYGVFVNGQAVCEGYAKAFELLMQKKGIECYLVTGVSKRVNHAWNLVKIVDQYCYIDLTKDDTDDDYISHAYFNMTTAQLLEEYTLGDHVIKMPECTADHLNYLARHNMIVRKPFNATEIRRHVSGYTLTVAVESKEDLKDLENYLRINILSLMSISGISGSQYYFDLTINGREVHVKLKLINHGNGWVPA